MEFGVQAEVRKESPGVCLRFASLKGEVRAKIGEEVEVEMSAIDHVRPEKSVFSFCFLFGGDWHVWGWMRRRRRDVCRLSSNLCVCVCVCARVCFKSRPWRQSVK